MAALADGLGVLAAQDRDDVVDAERLPHPGHAGEDLLGHHDRVRHVLRVAEADVAGRAVGLVVPLAEVRHQPLVPTGRAAGVAVHVVEVAQRRGHVLLAGPVLLGGLHDDRLQRHHVPAGVQQHALRRQTVAAGPAGLLLVVLDGLRHRRVQDDAHVRPIDPHAECDGRHDQRRLVLREEVLRPLAVVRLHAGVVADRRVALTGEHPGQRIDVLAAQAVNDPGLPLVAVEDFAHLPAHVQPRQHPEGEVRPVEVADEYVRVAQVKLLEDVRADLLGGGGGVGVDGGAGEQLAEPAELAVLGAKVVPPLADAVGLVHGDRTHPARGVEEPDEAVQGESLRGDEHQRRLAGEQRGGGVVALGGRLGAVEADGVDADAAEAIDLVLHQGDERGDDDGGAAAMDGRGLVDEGLAAAGRHDDEGVAVGEDRPDGPLLERPQRPEAPVPGDQREQVAGQAGRTWRVRPRRQAQKCDCTRLPSDRQPRRPTRVSR